MSIDLTDLAMLQLGQQAHLYDLTQMISRKDSSKRVEYFFHRMHKLLPLTHSLEIGAHEATYSQTVKKNYPHINCRAFEANTLVYSHFLLNGILNTGVDYINTAIGDKDGTAPFHIYTKINNIKEDSDSRRQSLLKRVDTPPEESEVSAVYVPITRLDNITKNDPENSLYSMWIDAEGATGMVLAGASETLKNTAIVYVEAESIPKFEGQINDKELMQYFMDRDYMPIVRDFQFLHQYNIIFVRKDLYTKIEHDLHNFLGYQKREVLANFFNIQGTAVEPVSITPPPLPKIEYKNVEELKKAIHALPHSTATNATENSQAKEFSINEWNTILNFVNILSDAESKRIYLYCVKSILYKEQEYMPNSAYEAYKHPHVKVEKEEYPECIKITAKDKDLSLLCKQEIDKSKPKLLLSLSNENLAYDVISIPQALLDMNLDYDFYCGHHSSYYNETILYGIKRG